MRKTGLSRVGSVPERELAEAEVARDGVEAEQLGDPLEGPPGQLGRQVADGQAALEALDLEMEKGVRFRVAGDERPAARAHERLLLGEVLAEYLGEEARPPSGVDDVPGSHRLRELAKASIQLAVRLVERRESRRHERHEEVG